MERTLLLNRVLIFKRMNPIRYNIPTRAERVCVELRPVRNCLICLPGRWMSRKLQCVEFITLMIPLLYSGVQITDNVPLLKVIFIHSNPSNEVRDTILTIAGTVMDYSDGLLPTPPFFFIRNDRL